MPENNSNGQDNSKNGEAERIAKERLDRLVQQMNAAMDKSRTNVAESAVPDERGSRHVLND
jgi:uncharacterized FlaG/YvyC family protein